MNILKTRSKSLVEANAPASLLPSMTSEIDPLGEEKTLKFGALKWGKKLSTKWGNKGSSKGLLKVTSLDGDAAKAPKDAENSADPENSPRNFDGDRENSESAMTASRRLHISKSGRCREKLRVRSRLVSAVGDPSLFVFDSQSGRAALSDPPSSPNSGPESSNPSPEVLTPSPKVEERQKAFPGQNQPGQNGVTSVGPSTPQGRSDYDLRSNEPGMSMMMILAGVKNSATKL